MLVFAFLSPLLMLLLELSLFFLVAGKVLHVSSDSAGFDLELTNLVFVGLLLRLLIWLLFSYYLSGLVLIVLHLCDDQKLKKLS